jgi:hypothetical protein
MGDITLTITGENFGETKTVPEVLIGGQDCAGATWHDPWVDPKKKYTPEGQLQKRAFPRPYVTCTAPKVTVGIKNITMTIAHQTVNIPTQMSSLETTCKAGFFGGADEFCARCGATVHTEGASCLEDNLYAPTAKLSFWQFNISGQDERCPPEMRGRESCPYFAACEPKEVRLCKCPLVCACVCPSARLRVCACVCVWWWWWWWWWCVGGGSG